MATDKEKKSKQMKASENAGAGAVYGLGWVGALVYYFVNADTFMMFVMGFLKAIVWPAILVYKLFELVY